VTTLQTTKRYAAVTGLALVAVIGVGSVVGSNSAADDLTPTAYKALVNQGLGNVSVDFDGREAKLASGTPEELAKAEKIVEGIEGVRSANVSSDHRREAPDPRIGPQNAYRPTLGRVCQFTPGSRAPASRPEAFSSVDGEHRSASLLRLAGPGADDALADRPPIGRHDLCRCVVLHGA